MSMDTASARAAMVEGQVRTNDVPNRALQAAMRAVPRELYAPKAKRAVVYGDLDVPVAEGRWLIRPRDFAKLLHALTITEADHVLDVACARGYSAAVLARLAGSVVGLESDTDLVEKANATLSKHDVNNAVVVAGDLKVGVPDQGPFDVIVVNGAVEVVPHSWFEQLAEGGRLGVVVRKGPVGKATIFTRAGGAIGDKVSFDSAAPLLPGFEAPATFSFG